MKKLFAILLLAFVCTVTAQEIHFEKHIVDAACGQCMFEMTEKKGCDLAVKIDGKTCFVEGTGIDDHGDAHAPEGFCNAIRKAEVSGMVKDNKFLATQFRLLSLKEAEEVSSGK